MPLSSSWLHHLELEKSELTLSYFALKLLRHSINSDSPELMLFLIIEDLQLPQ